MKSCDHCLLQVPEDRAIRCKTPEGFLYFCCTGCRAVNRIIREEGLSRFYSARRGWKPGPPEEFRNRGGSFDRFVKEEGNLSTIEVYVKGIRCASCVWLVENYLKKRKGVRSVRVNFATHNCRISWDPGLCSLGDIFNRISKIGYDPRPYEPTTFSDDYLHENRDLLLRFGTAAFFSMQLMLYTVALYAGYFQGIEEIYKKLFQFIAWGLATPVIFYSGFPFLKSTIRSVKSKNMGMDTLVVIGSSGAYYYSVFNIFRGEEVYFDTASMIITLILLGRFLESGAKLKAADVARKLVALVPEEARRVKTADGDKLSEREAVPIDMVKAGDLIEILPGDRIPLDGTVIEGVSEVDESPLTGESVPVLKGKDDSVFAGTLNRNGILTFMVTATGEDTTLSRIVRVVWNAQMEKSPLQRLSDRIVGYFVPFVLAVASGTFIFWFIKSGTTLVAIFNAISVLVIACPCALGIATPLAVLIGSQRCAARGILVKGGDVLEGTATIDTVFLDKTGTLTRGAPEVTGVIPVAESEEGIMEIAAALENSSEHTIAKAICAAYGRSIEMDTQDFRAHPGRGVEGVIGHGKYFMGKPEYLMASGVPIRQGDLSTFEEVSGKGRTAVMVGGPVGLLGIISVEDSLRDEAAESIMVLKSMGIEVGMLTGDNESVSRKIASDVGIKTFFSGLTPDEKALRIQDERDTGRSILMVGDGINDAPALFAAEVGVAMGRGTDIAIESADAVLMREDLRLIPELISISQKTYSVIKQNLAWAFSYNLIALPLAVTGLLHPIMSAGLMAASSLIVVGNSLRLKKGAD